MNSTKIIFIGVFTLIPIGIFLILSLNLPLGDWIEIHYALYLFWVSTFYLVLSAFYSIVTQETHY